MAVVIVPRKLWPLISIFWAIAGAVEGQGRRSRSVTSKNRILPACLKIQVIIFLHHFDNAKFAKICWSPLKTQVPHFGGYQSELFPGMTCNNRLSPLGLSALLPVSSSSGPTAPRCPSAIRVASGLTRGTGLSLGGGWS